MVPNLMQKIFTVYPQDARNTRMKKNDSQFHKANNFLRYKGISDGNIDVTYEEIWNKQQALVKKTEK